MGIPTLISNNIITSATTNLDITSGIDNTYDEYMFVITDFHPVVDGVALSMAAATDAGSPSYSLLAKSTAIKAHHTEADATQFGYHTDTDRTTYPFYITSPEVGNDNDENGASIVHLFAPASTTYVKHFLVRTSQTISNPGNADVLVGGYFDTTSDIEAVRFGTSNGDIENIYVQMYGIS